MFHFILSLMIFILTSLRLICMHHKTKHLCDLPNGQNNCDLDNFNKKILSIKLKLYICPT
jgi:hypothetical protein